MRGCVRCEKVLGVRGYKDEGYWGGVGRGVGVDLGQVGGVDGPFEDVAVGVAGDKVIFWGFGWDFYGGVVLLGAGIGILRLCGEVLFEFCRFPLGRFDPGPPRSSNERVYHVLVLGL